MKRSLIGTSALVAAGLLATTGAANAADPIKLGVGGYANAAIAYVSEDETATPNVRNHGIQLDTEIVFRGSTTLDNGLEFGVKIEMATDTAAPAIDEQMIYIENEDSWGRIEMGDEDGASDQFRHLGPFVIGSSITGCSTFTAPEVTNANFPFTCGGVTNDQTKITYRGPKLIGLQWGISYTPETANFNGIGSAARGNADAGDVGGVVELGANWSGTFGGASIKAGGGWASLPAEGAGEFDANQWNFGATVSMSGWNFGGSIKNQDNGAPAAQDTDQTNVRLGITTKMAGMTVGVEYTKATLTSATTQQDDETTGYSIAANRTLGPGVSMGVLARAWDMADDANVATAENSATEVLIITSLGF
ncbi:porin [Alphaproteobacteria bacterium]|nr:porin [Alphaproteobacteria bacterium]